MRRTGQEDIGGHGNAAPESMEAAPSSRLYFYINSFLTLLVGNMFNYAMVIMSRSLTGSDGFTGLVFLGVFGPTIFLGLYAGILLDRHKRKNILYISQFVILTNSLLFAVLCGAGLVTAETRWMILAASIVHGSCLAFIIPGRFAFLGNLTAPEKTGRATILLNILVLTAFGSAPIFTGFIKASFAYYMVFGIIAVGFAIAYLFLLPIRPVMRPRSEGATDLLDGFRFIRGEGLVLQFLIFSFVGFFMVGPIQVLFPEFARTTLGLGESGRGVFMSMLGLGLFLGGILARLLDGLSGRGRFILVSTLLAGILVASMAEVASVRLASILLILAGVFGAVLSTLIPAAIQERTPDRYRGRVMSVYSMIFQATPALSGFAMGMLADARGLLAAIFVSGLLVAAAALLCVPGLPLVRRYN